jgi:tetratricopeptide (TPR) repeat protein
MGSEQVQSTDPLFIAAVYLYRGLTLSHLGRYDEAIRDFTRSFDTGSGAGAALGNRALVYLRLQRSGEAEADLARLEELFPEEAGTFYNKACFYCLCGNYDEALAALTTAIQGYPKYGPLAATDADFDQLRFDARFRRLVGLPAL